MRHYWTILVHRRGAVNVKVEFQILEAIAPDVVKTIQHRFQIMEAIDWLEPVGRRVLAEKLQLTERVLRTETDYLKKIGLLDTSKSGMSLSSRGKAAYNQMLTLKDRFDQDNPNEMELAAKFQIERCLIIPGDSDTDEAIQNRYGKIVSEVLDYLLLDKENIIAVMGGTTMAAVAEHMTKLNTGSRKNIFVPARGGVGESGHIQANFVCETMAKNARGSYRTLYVPEHVSEETYKPLLQEPSVKSVLEMVRKPDCVVHSIGEALVMAERREMSKTDIHLLKKEHAVAESFGYFFNAEGKVVYKIPRIGLQLKDLDHVPIILAVAGGKKKAKAISAYMKNAPKQTWLITDEGAAKTILNGETH